MNKGYPHIERGLNAGVGWCIWKNEGRTATGFMIFTLGFGAQSIETSESLRTRVILSADVFLPSEEKVVEHSRISSEGALLWKADFPGVDVKNDRPRAVLPGSILPG